MNQWDKYFHLICQAVSSKSPCMSRKIGAVIVRDHSIVSTGFNGPPRGVPHCGEERYIHDKYLQSFFGGHTFPSEKALNFSCPRRLLSFESGKGLDLCTAAHAETNAIVNAARMGVVTVGGSLYLDTVIPCNECMKLIINAGIVEIVCDSLQNYSEATTFLLESSRILLRQFQL